MLILHFVKHHWHLCGLESFTSVDRAMKDKKITRADMEWLHLPLEHWSCNMDLIVK